MNARALVLVAVLALLAGCGKKTEVPQVDAAKQREDALEEARKGAFGTQVQALDKAKALEADVNKKAQDSVDRAEKDAK